MAQEIELKLFFQSTHLDRMVSHPLILAGKPLGAGKTLENTYFDTPDLTLHAARVAIRTRQTGSGVLQTVKCAAQSSGGLSSRPEWEQAYTGQFDFSAVDEVAVRDLLDRLKPTLVPVFSTVFERQTRRFEPRPGVVILMMIDIGRVVAPGGESPISELELELVEGSAADLQRFAIELAENLPLIPFDRSKAERGYRLFLNEVDQPVKFGSSPVTAAMTPGEAFKAIALRAQACWQVNQLGAMASDDPEYVHQFRVALRRLNTLLKVFSPVLDDDLAARWSEDLKGLAGLTGEARDLDVMLETVLKPMRAESLGKSGKALVEIAIQACKKARKAAEKAVGKLETGQQLLQFSRDIDLLPSRGTVLGIEAFAEKRLGKMHRRAVKRLKLARKSLTPENAHSLRISLKHLRYSCEFFAPLFDESAMLKFAKDVAALQDELGVINDLHMALIRLAQWAETDKMLRETRDFIADWHAGRITRKLSAALMPAEALLGTCLPWCKECDRQGLEARNKKSKK